MGKISHKLKKIYFDLHACYTKMGIIKYYNNKIKKVTNKSLLTKKQVREIKDYFKNYKHITTKYHNFYYEKTGIYDINYLPDDLYYCDIDMYYNNWRAAEILDNKCFYRVMFKNIKQPETVVMRINGFWYDKEMNILSFADVINELLKEKEVFIKEAVESAGGKGVRYLKISKNNLKKEFIEIINGIKVDIIIQKSLKQHKVLNCVNSSSVNTIRILSLLSQEGVKIYSSILRMGVNGSKVDNASSGGITCGINDDGFLKKCAFSANGDKFDKHPTSGISFSEIKIPKFKEMKELIIKTHPLIPHFRLVSWDIALDENENIVLIEANLKYGELDFHQLNNGPVFGKDTKIILEEVFKNRR